MYFKNLDALRFFSFLSVFFYHSFYTSNADLVKLPVYKFFKLDVFGNGYLGVNFFFVLSGFLITYLLLKEQDVHGSLSLGKFYMRRILRIWPLFYLTVFIGFALFPLVKQVLGVPYEESAHLWTYLLFINNFDRIAYGLPDASMLGVLWSVAIEEQFYLVWPALVLILPKARLWMGFMAFVVVSLTYRATTENLSEYHTLACVGDLAIGALGAWLVHCRSIDRWFEQVPKWMILMAYFSFLFIFVFRDELANASKFWLISERVITALVILFIILEQNYAQRSWFKLGSIPAVNYLGKISYGLYCLHFVGILCFTVPAERFGLDNDLWLVMLGIPFGSLLLTILIAHVSFQYFERPFLSLKRKFATT